MALRNPFARPVAPARVPRVPPGQRVYAIGDIHGRADCLERLLAAIDDDARQASSATTIVFLGDLVDRGPDSCGVVERAMARGAAGNCVFVMGNHEEVMIRAWEGEAPLVRLFHQIGGRETLISYGVDAAHYDRADLNEVARMIAAHVPAEHVAFLRQMRDGHIIGDYTFVHAGIRPGVAHDAQQGSDLRWIRREFLDDRRDHGTVVVHGHTVTPEVERLPNRIGIDTGAYASGRLTAIGLEGTDQWFLTG